MRETHKIQRERKKKSKGAEEEKEDKQKSRNIQKKIFISCMHTQNKQGRREGNIERNFEREGI